MGNERSISIRDLEPSDRGWARAFLLSQQGSTRVVSRGRLHPADELPGFVASCDGAAVALLTYSVRDTELEVITLHSAVPGIGLGTRLLAAARERARELECRRMWLVTTNDNEPAIRFYGRRGMRLVAVHRGAVAESRKLKPEIPLFGVDGQPIEDEVEFELRFG